MARFNVTSDNRLAVRRLLTANGLPAHEVRVYSVRELGDKLEALVEAGKVPEFVAEDACGTSSDTRRPPVTIDATADEILSIPPCIKSYEPTAPAKGADSADASPTGRASDVQTAVSDALSKALGPVLAGLLGKQGVDSDAVRKIVQEELSTIRPIVIHVKHGDKTQVVNGRTHAVYADVLLAVGQGLHVWLVGPSGSGKSYLASQVAEGLDRPFYSTGAVLSKYDLIGFVKPDGGLVRTPFRDAFEHGGVFSWDDVDGSDPRAIVAFNEALANGRFAFPDGMVTAHQDFVAIASANTWGNGATADYVGRAKLDAATLTRFVQVFVDYDEELERTLVGRAGEDWVRYVQRVRRAVHSLGIKVLVTPRQTIQGAKLLAAGMPRDKVEAVTLWRGLDSPSVEKIKRAA